MGVGHFITNQDTIVYVIAKAHICNRFVIDNANVQLVKSNTYRYKKEQKYKAIHSKKSFRMSRYSRKVADDGHTPLQMAPVIHMTSDMVEECDNEDNGDNESNNASE